MCRHRLLAAGILSCIESRTAVSGPNMNFSILLSVLQSLPRKMLSGFHHLEHASAKVMGDHMITGLSSMRLLPSGL